MMTESLIQPRMFRLPELTRKVVLFYNLQHFKMFHQQVNGSKVKAFGPARRFQWDGNVEKVTVLGGMIGAPLAVMIAEMAMAAGAQRFWAFGTAGSTGAEHLEFGELLSPAEGYDKTGICHDYADEAPCQLFEAHFDCRRCRAITSVNSFFRLTSGHVDQYRKSGIQLIDMEAAPLNCVIRRQNKSFFPLFLVSDRVDEGMAWENGSHQDPFKAGLKAGLDLLSTCG